MRPFGSAEELERRRRRAIGLLQAGHRQADVARRVDAHPTSVKRWWEAYQKNGEGGLTAKPAPGRPSKMTARQRNRLVARLLKGGKANGVGRADSGEGYGCICTMCATNGSERLPGRFEPEGGDGQTVGRLRR